MTDTLNDLTGPPSAQTWTVVDGVATDPNAQTGPGTGTAREMPAWTRSRAAAAASIRRALTETLAETRFQVAMLPTYWCRLAKEAPTGLGSALAAAWHWTVDAEGRHTLHAARSSSNDAKGDLVKLQADHRTAMRNHALADLAVLLVAGAGLLRLAQEGGPLAWALAAMAIPLVVVPVLGAVGRSPDAPPIVERYIGTGWTTPKLTEPLIRDAFDILGLPNWSTMMKSDHPDRSLRLLTPVQRLAKDDGYTTTLSLPAGYTIDQVRDRRAALASGLSRQPSCVRIADTDYEGARGVDRVLDLIVMDRSIRDLDSVPWPWLAHPAPQSLFAPSPIGVDESGDPVMLPPLVGEHGLIAGQTGSGKTGTAQTIMAILAFDPSCRITIVDGKCSGDWLPWRDLCEEYHPDASDPAVIADLLERIAQRVLDRQALITKLRDDYELAFHTAHAEGRTPPPDPFPDGAKVSAALAAKYPELRQEVLIFEEVQTIFQEWGKDAKDERGRCEKSLTTIAKKGRSAGSSIWVVTQQVNADTLPTSISNNLGVRITLSVQTPNEAIAAGGLSAYQKGYDASQLTKDEDKGIAVVSGGAVSAPSMTKTHYIVPQIRQVVAAARSFRAAAGTLPTDEPTGPELSFLDRVQAVWPQDRDALQFAELAGLLADAYPDACAGWGVRQVSGAAASAGLPTGQDAAQVKRTVDGKTSNRRGVSLADVLEAAATELLARADDTDGQDLED